MNNHVTLAFDSGTRWHALHVSLATSPLARMRGLLGRAPLASNQAMFIRPCNMVHTVGMRYPIDVVFLNRDGLVLKVAANVAPQRMRLHWDAYAVLELAAGQARACAIVPGLMLPTGAL